VVTDRRVYIVLNLLIYMKSDEEIRIPLRHGRTNGTNLPHMTEGKLLATGYNSVNGLVNVCEDDGELYYEGRVNIESELPKILSEEGSANPDNVDQYITKRYEIMKLKSELAGSINKPDLVNTARIALKLRKYEAELGVNSRKVDSKVDQYIMRAYENSRDNPDSNPTPILEVLTNHM